MADDASNAARAMAELMVSVDSGILNSSKALELQSRGACLRQGLAYSMTLGHVSVVLCLAHQCNARLEDNASATSPKELFMLASQDDWTTVAYQLAVAAGSVGCCLVDLLSGRDEEVREKLRQAAGQVRVQLPNDVRLAFVETGKSPAVLFVESKRWLLPRPKREESYVALDGSKLEDGWYCVVQYPVADDLRHAILRRRHWDGDSRVQASDILAHAGETLLCKAAKRFQWELVEWIIDEVNDARGLVEQLSREFEDLWQPTCERKALLRNHQDLAQLCACLDNDATLTRQWRHGVLTIEEGAKVLWPKIDALREALSLGNLSLDALRLIGGAQVTIHLNQSEEKRNSWFADLAGLGERTFAYPLLHRAAVGGCTNLVSRLIQAMVDLEACDSRGFTALAAAAMSRKWDVLETLVNEGCRADGSSGAVAINILQREVKKGVADIVEVERSASLLEKLKDRKMRAPASNLSEYFLWKIRGDIVHGIEPRNYELLEGELKCRSAPFGVSANALVMDAVAQDHEVRFVVLDTSEFGNLRSAGILDLARHRLYKEPQLTRVQVIGAVSAVAVAIPSARLAAGGPDGADTIAAARNGPFAVSLPAFAKAQPAGGLLVESITSCCRESVGRVEIIVDGVRIGETHEPAMGSAVSKELELLVPAREMEIVAELSGRRLLSERRCGGPGEDMCIEVGIAIYIYVQLVDEEERVEFVFVCAHRRDVPEDSRPFVGVVTWDEGKQQLASQQLMPIGDSECLKRFMSLRFQPELPEGRCFEAVSWEDTDACQFQRCLVNPVRVGKISNA